MSRQAELLDASQRLLVPNYGARLRAMVRSAGARIWDADDNEYVDFFAGFGGGGIAGHCHPKDVAAVKEQAESLLGHGNFFTNDVELQLAEKVTGDAFGGKVFYCHSGGEANEAPLKLARLAAGEGRYKIVSFANCFHGRTMGGNPLCASTALAAVELVEEDDLVERAEALGERLHGAIADANVGCHSFRAGEQ